MVFSAELDLIIVVFLIAVFLRYSGYLTKEMKRPVGYILGGTLFLLINQVWGLWTGFYPSIQTWISYVWGIIAFILILIGGLWTTFEFIKG
jgi:hypothetical protein